jgi:serine/threonine protein kinase
MHLGKYELLCELATGSMGTVHVARPLGATDFTRLVAIKRLHPHLLKEPHFRSLVRDEARLASQIHHPNVVPVVDVVEQEGELCLVLEYVPSVPLSALVRAASDAGEALSSGVVSRVMIDALAGLHAAHEVHDAEGRPLGIVHRDVTPQNVIVGVDGSARLIDFGIAKAAVNHAMTKSGELKGKLPYISPEQVRREPLDRRADVFAAGAVTFEALTGKRRFDGEDEGAVLLGIVLGEPCDLTELGFSFEVDEIINKALARSAEDRFPSARAFQEALEEVIAPASHAEVAETVGRLCGARLAEQRARVCTPPVVNPDATVKISRRRSRWPLALPLIVVAAGAAYYVHASRNRPMPAIAQASPPPSTASLPPPPPPPPSAEPVVSVAPDAGPPPPSPKKKHQRPRKELKKNPFR